MPNVPPTADAHLPGSVCSVQQAECLCPSGTATNLRQDCHTHHATLYSFQCFLFKGWHLKRPCGSQRLPLPLTRTACMIATGLLPAGVSTNPADVLKVRLQMQNELMVAELSKATSKAPQQRQLSLLQMLRGVVTAEGPAALMNGWQASVMREMSYSAIRMGLYDEVKELLAGGRSQGRGVVLTCPYWWLIFTFCPLVLLL